MVLCALPAQPVARSHYGAANRVRQGTSPAGAAPGAVTGRGIGRSQYARGMGTGKHAQGA